jgi:hyaluronan synthase
VFASLAWHLTLSGSRSPSKVTRDEQRSLDRLRVVLNVPCFNEDPQVLRTALEAILRQTRPFDRVEVVNDGSDTNVERLAQVESWWRSQQNRTTTRLE